ncbi:MAG: MgtC/SapB family protein [Hyphomicrobiales bacterium]
MPDFEMLLSPEQPLTRLAVALAIGLLIGLERGWSARDEREGERAAGFRTHAISGLLGGIAALIGLRTTPLVIGFAFLGFAGVSLMFHWLEARDEKNFSATGAIAGLMAFLLGALSVVGEPGLAAAAATATVVLLALKSTLHGFLKRLDWIELRAVLILVTMSFLLLPLLPDRTIDPWETLNPARIWELAIFVCAISFIGYIGIRIFGERRGILIAALAGGLVSSTAATLNFARLAKLHASDRTVMTGAIALAGSVMCIRILIIVGIFNFTLALIILPMMVAAMIVQAVIGLLLISNGMKRSHDDVIWKNPFDVGSALRFSILIAIILMISTLVARHYGSEALMSVSAFAGLADVDAITLSLARMQEPLVDLKLAADGVLVAALTNTVMKAVLAGIAGGAETGWRVSAVNLAAVLTAGATYLLVGA